MFLKTLKLTNFRNYSSLDFKFNNSTTVLIGDNAQGKTNFLESIYLLATGKSSRAEQDEELVKDGEEILRVEGDVVAEPRVTKEPESQEDAVKLEIAMLLQGNSLRKKISVNGIPRRLIDYTSNLAVILFRPEDINLVIGSPSLRRNHIDQIISQVDSDYKKTLSAYEKVIVRKNKLLAAIREGFSKPDELTYWTDNQILLGNHLTTKRQDYFKFINSEKKLFGDFSYLYHPSEVTLERLNEYRQKEIYSANSLIGPHRDDFTFLLSKKDLSKFGSRGEQRTAVLDLKFAEVEYVENVLGSRPILLLDDIFSELDLNHRTHVIDLAHQQQTVISTVEWDGSLKKALKDAAILEVKNGVITD